MGTERYAIGGGMKPGRYKLAAVHDLSGYGRASLTVAVPVLSSMGIQVCPLPTALLSTQTSGFTDYTYLDLTDEMYGIIDHWEAIGLEFDCIYSGFLGSGNQAACVADMFRRLGKDGALFVVDPVLGDNGSSYGPISEELIAAMGELIAEAHLITPNFTEAAMLLHEPYPNYADENSVLQWLKRLSSQGPSRVVITSVPLQGSDSSNFVYAHDSLEGAVYRLQTPRLPFNYAGAGDMFTSILIGSLAAGEEFPSALARAAEQVLQAVQHAADEGVSEREGVLLEPVLPHIAASPPSFTCEKVEDL